MIFETEKLAHIYMYESRRTPRLSHGQALLAVLSVAASFRKACALPQTRRVIPQEAILIASILSAAVSVRMSCAIVMIMNRQQHSKC